MPEYGVCGGDMEIEVGDDHVQQINLTCVNHFSVTQPYCNGLVIAVVYEFAVDALQKSDGFGDPGLKVGKCGFVIFITGYFKPS